LSELYLDNSSTCNGLAFQIWNFSKTGSYPPTKSGDSLCLSPGTQITSTSVFLFESTSSSDVCSLQGIVTYTTSNNLIYATALCLAMNYSNDSGALRINSSSPLVIDVGTNTVLSGVEVQPGLFAILELHGDGYCYNSHTHNTRASPRICSQSPQSTKNVLVYNYGLYSSWLSYLLQPLYSNTTTKFITSCNAEILHGSYDQGHNPYGSIFSSDNSIAAVEVHNGWTDVDVDWGSCGKPVSMAPGGGVILDSWLLPRLGGLP